MTNYAILFQLCNHIRIKESVIDAIEAARNCMLITNSEADKLAHEMGVTLSVA